MLSLYNLKFKKRDTQYRNYRVKVMQVVGPRERRSCCWDSHSRPGVGLLHGHLLSLSVNFLVLLQYPHNKSPSFLKKVARDDFCSLPTKNLPSNTMKSSKSSPLSRWAKWCTSIPCFPNLSSFWDQIVRIRISGDTMNCFWRFPRQFTIKCANN